MENPDFKILEYELLCLEDPVVLPEHKLRASASLTQGGKPAIEILVQRLALPGDPIFMEGLLVPTGVMNPGPPRIMTVTLKFQIESILYELLCPEQAPRPELRGDTPSIPKQSLTTNVPSPLKTLAEMKADWDNARDLAIGELAPAELGPAYAFISDWTQWWSEHHDMTITELKNWSLDQVKRHWALNTSSRPEQPHRPSRPGAQETVSLPDNLDFLKRSYEQAWTLFTGAAGNTSRTPIATKALKDIGFRHPYLAPHIEYLLRQLA